MARTINADGLDFNGKKFVKKKLNNSLAPDGAVRGAGEPLTLKAANAMIMHYIEPIITKRNAATTDAERQELGESNIAVFYGKETLMLLLAQANCEGIRFYFCTNHHNKQSLVLVGIDGEKSDLGLPAGFNSLIDPGLDIELTKFSDDGQADEVGGPKTLNDYLNVDEHAFSPDPVSKALVELLKNNL